MTVKRFRKRSGVLVRLYVLTLSYEDRSTKDKYNPLHVNWINKTCGVRMIHLLGYSWYNNDNNNNNNNSNNNNNNSNNNNNDFILVSMYLA